MAFDDRDQTPVATLVRTALAEDIGPGDVTSLATIPAITRSHGRIVAKADGTIAGTGITAEVFAAVDPAIRVSKKIADGKKVASGDVIMEVSGPARSLLSAERTALNFLQRLSGIATATSRYVEAVEGTGVKIIDTRKTTPGWRLLEKQAVVAGGGTNHRTGLFDMVLIKENHIRAAGGIEKAVRSCKSWLRENGRNALKIEVETTSMAEVEDAIRAGCDRIMLDNMSLDEMRDAVNRIRQEQDGPEIEASGNMSVDRVRAVAETGVDFISVGAITHSAPVLDLSLLFDITE